MANVIKSKRVNRKVTIPIATVVHSKPVSSLPSYRCPFCGDEWMPRKSRPKVCPTCHRLLPWPVTKRGRPSKRASKKRG
jgi:rubrerythrin